MYLHLNLLFLLDGVSHAQQQPASGIETYYVPETAKAILSQKFQWGRGRGYVGICALHHSLFILMLINHLHLIKNIMPPLTEAFLYKLSQLPQPFEQTIRPP